MKFNAFDAVASGLHFRIIRPCGEGERMDKKKGFLAASLFVLVACCFILLGNGAVDSSADSPPEGAICFDAGDKKIIISSVDVKNSSIKGVPLWRLQSPLEIEKTGDLNASISGSLIYYEDNGWDMDAWDVNKSKGYYLVIDLCGTTASFKKIGNIEYADSYWTPSGGDTRLIYHIGKESADKSIDFVTTENVGFTLNICDKINKIPSVLKISADGKYDLSQKNNDGTYKTAVPTENYCLIIEPGVTSLVCTEKYSGARKVSLLGEKLSYVVVGPECTKLGALAGWVNASNVNCGYVDGNTGESKDADYCGIFTGCKSLKGLTILSQLETIQSRTFQGCSSLESIELQGAIGTNGDTNGNGPFDGCTQLNSVSIVGNIWLISKYINKNGKENVSYNNNCFSAINSADNRNSGLFTNCGNLIEISVDEDNVKIGDYIFGTFSNTKGTKESRYVAITSNNCKFVVNGTNCSIGNKTFYDTGIIDIEGWDKISHIGMDAFAKAPFTEVSIGPSVDCNLESAFNGCDNVKSFTISSDNSTYSFYGGVIYDKQQSEIIGIVSTLLSGVVVIPGTVTSIPDGIFAGTIIDGVDLNEGIVTIGANAFRGCAKVSQVTIPLSVATIGASAFEGCADTGTITFKGDIVPIELGDGYIPNGWRVVAPTITGNRLYIEAEHGSISATHSGNGQNSVFRPSSILSEGSVTLTYNDQSSFEFLNWVITSGNSIDESKTQKTITISFDELTQNTTVSVKLRYYSQSNVLSNIFDFDSPTSSSDFQTLWQFRSTKTSAAGMGGWTITSTPLVVDDYVYAYTGNELYKLEGSTGEVLATAYVDELDGVYYRYLGYGGGYILDFNSKKVFDLDLHQICTIEGNLRASFYENGVNYGLFSENGLKLKQFTIDKSGVNFTTGFSVDVTGWYNNFYGTTSAPVVLGNHLYYISGSETTHSGKVVPYKVYLNSVDLSTGAKKTTDLGLDYKYLDDGWLTTDGTYLYLTSYVGGLDAGKEVENSNVYNETNSTVTRITVDQYGSMTKEFDVDLGYKGITSQFVVYNGRGYVNVNDPSAAGYVGFLLVYDMSNLSAESEPIYKTRSTYTHGSIVLNAMNVGGNEKVYVYMISYYMRDGVIAIEDYAGKTAPTEAIVLKTGELTNYCSQGIRFLPNGSLVFYHDPGNIFCLGPTKLNEFFCFIGDVTDSKSGKWINVTGPTIDEALADSELLSVSDKVLLGARIDDSSKWTSGWNVFYLKDGQWIKSSGNTIDGTQTDLKGRHYWQIVKGESYVEPGSKWSYDSKPYSFSSTMGSRDVLNKTMTFGAVATHYSITVPTNVNADVESSVQKIYKGGIVEITAKPYSGFCVDSVSYIVAGSSEVKIESIGTDTYRFSMPEADVSIVVHTLPVYTVRYHTGVGIGKDVEYAFAVKNTVTEDLTVYQGYKLTIKLYSNADEVIFPEWLNPDERKLQFTGVVPLGIEESVFKTTTYWGDQSGKQYIYVYEIKLKVNTSEYVSKQGKISISDNPEDVKKDDGTFLGWSTSSNATTPELSVGQDYDLVSNLDLYAVWSGEKPTVYTITLNMSGGESSSVIPELGWKYDGNTKTWSRQFLSGAAFPTIADPSKVADSSNTYVFTSWDSDLPTSINESKTYMAMFIEKSIIRYNVVCADSEDSNSMRTYTLNIDRSMGAENIDDARLLVIADYGGKFVNVYSKIDLDNNGRAVEKVKLSITGLTGLTFDIVSGFPVGLYESYGTLMPELV